VPLAIPQTARDPSQCSMRPMLSGAAYTVKTIVAKYPMIANPIERARGHGEVVRPDTDIVIESFPRCASSFAVAAFRLAQEPKPMTIAHHTHMPASVITAVRRRIPAVVLIRPAEDAVLSLVIRTPTIPIGSALGGYVRFYETLLPYRERFVSGTFEQVVGDFGAVIRRVNARFGTGFAPFVHDPANLARIDREIEEDHRTRASDDADLERFIPRPSSARASVKEGLRPRFRSQTRAATRQRAVDLYAAFSSMSA
jgi:hypothetical protein